MPAAKILIVDDDGNLLAFFEQALRRRFHPDTALSGQAALELVRSQGPYAVVLADMNMPGMSGAELLERVAALAPDTVRMMLTADTDRKTAISAVNRGHVFLFLEKPSSAEALESALEAGIRQHDLIRGERELIEGTLAGSVKLLTDVLGMIAPEALGRGQRLREAMSAFARFAKAEPAWELELAALLSSIGHASLPVSLLRKMSGGAELDPREHAILRRMPRVGADLLADIPRLANVARIVLFQDKQFDGGGFPEETDEGPVPLGARMLKILRDRAELEDDGTAGRLAREEMKSRTGWYDPALLDLCFDCFRDYLPGSLSSGNAVLSRAVAELSPGQIVVSDIATRSGLKLVGAGNRLTAAMIARLANFAELGDVNEPVLVQSPADASERAA